MPKIALMVYKALLLERDIRRFNEQLNKYDYGIVVDGKAYTDNIDFSKYTTIDPDAFK